MVTDHGQIVVREQWDHPYKEGTEDCKLVVTCKMQNRNATDKLSQQCNKLALFANEIIGICGRITMLVYYIVDLAHQLHFYFAFCK